MILDIIASLAALALAAPEAAPEVKKAAKPRMECRTEGQTSSRIGRKKICTTKKIWDQIREENLESTAHRKVDAERSLPFTMPPR